MNENISKERAEELREWLEDMARQFACDCDFVGEAITADILAIFTDYDRLKAENERLVRELAILELSEGQAIHETGMAVEHFKKAEAELARYRPLIEAVERLMRLIESMQTLGYFTTHEWRARIGDVCAALAARKEAK